VNSKTDYRKQTVKEWGMPEWEEFVCDLREEIPDERCRGTWVSHHKLVNKDRVDLETFCARFDPDLIDNGLHVVLEVYCTNDGRCVLAIVLLSESPLEKAKKQFVTLLKQSAQKHGLDVVDEPEGFIPEFVNTIFCQPKNLTSRSTPAASGFVTRVFCQPKNQGCWLAKDANGKLDMQATAENFRKAVEMILDDDVFDDPSREACF